MKKIAIVSLLLVSAVLATTASAVQMFDFDAQAVVPAAPGDAAAYGRIVNGAAVATPLPLDFANFEYTLVVSSLPVLTSGATSTFGTGIVTIYQDAATAADWANPASFTDGTAILTGTLSAFQTTMFTGTLGSGAGFVDWTGGSRVDELAPADRLGWPFLTAVSRAVSQVQPGYTERWDGKVEPLADVVDAVDGTWSGIKARFR